MSIDFVDFIIICSDSYVYKGFLCLDIYFGMLLFLVVF